MRRVAPNLFAAALLAGNAFAQAPVEESYGPQPARAEAAQAWYEANQQAHHGQPDLLVLPGLVADRSRQRVELLASQTESRMPLGQILAGMGLLRARHGIAPHGGPDFRPALGPTGYDTTSDL